MNNGSKTIQRSNLDGSGLETVYTLSNSGHIFSDIEVDQGAGKIYWSETRTFRRANLDGSNVETLLDANVNPSLKIPGKFILDTNGGKVYFTSTSSTVNWNRFVYSMNMNGSNPVLLFEANTNPSVTNAMVADFALDAAGGKIYWTNTNGLDTIGRANLDGSNLQTLIPDSAPGFSFRELQLDVAGGKMYWTSNDFTRSFQRANLDGTGQELLISGVGLALGFDLDIPAGKMYWVNGNNPDAAHEGSVERANLDGTALQTLITDLNITSFINLPALSLNIVASSGGSWATSISPGPADEAGQAVSFEITSNSNPGLFLVAPAVSPSGVLTYTPAANANGVAVLSIVLHDNGGTANGGQDTSPAQVFTITVNSVNDAPGGANSSLTTNEDTTLTVPASSFGFTDTDGNAFSRVKITTLPAVGTLRLNGVALSAGAFVTKSQLDANQLTFTPATNGNGQPYTSFTFQVEDDGGTDNGGVNLDASPNTLTINVTPVNDAPALSSSNLTLNAASIVENQSVSLSGSFSDPDANDFHTVSIDWGDGSTPSLLNLGAGVQSFSSVSHRYLDDAPTGTASDVYTITVTVIDSQSLGGPALSSSGPVTKSLTVTNAAPTPTSLSLSANTINENGSVTLNGVFTDAGSLDTHSVIINWGDGTTSTVSPTTVSPVSGTGGLYGVSSATDSLYKIDSATGVATLVTPIARDLAFAGATFLNGELYVSTLGPGSPSFGKVDLTTGAFTPINNMAGDLNWWGLAADPATGASLRWIRMRLVPLVNLP